MTMPSHTPALLLWAHGRSATDTLFGTLENDAHIRGCNGVKEGFAHDKVSESKLLTCVRTACTRQASSCIVGTHIKPMHLHGSALPTPPQLINAAHRANWRLMIAQYRPNHLAAMVSSFELMAGLQHVTDPRSLESKGLAHFGIDLPAFFASMDQQLVSGVETAVALGWRVVALDFSDITHSLCNSSIVVRRELHALGHTSLASSIVDTRAAASGHACRPHIGHTSTSHRSLPWYLRVGGERVAARVRAQLNGTIYEWMTAVARDVPPPAYLQRSAYLRYVRAAAARGQLSGGAGTCNWCRQTGSGWLSSRSTSSAAGAAAGQAGGGAGGGARPAVPVGVAVPGAHMGL